jgi:hypothetical protein
MISWDKLCCACEHILYDFGGGPRRIERIVVAVLVTIAVAGSIAFTVWAYLHSLDTLADIGVPGI